MAINSREWIIFILLSEYANTHEMTDIWYKYRNNHIMKSKLLLILIPAVFISCSRETASISENSLTFPTYSFSDPDPVPHPERNFYPYFRFDGYTKDSQPAEWKVVEMENPYVKVHIFPEIGGKVWGAVEKNTGNEFIYYNSVVKFRNIAMRGPWTSGGIEFNFGIIGHSPTVSTPVDYLLKNNDDGSVSCFVGAWDLLTRTRWETEINLQPDKAYFTTTTRWSNPSPLTKPYYQWSNAAFQAEGDLEMSFPGAYHLGHGGDAHSWPADEAGRNLDFYRNNDFGDSKSYHIVGKPEGFFAAYWHDLNFGAGHYAPYGDKLGKKIWLWSQARSGAIWEDLLTDTDGQYVELQSGRLFNQAATGSTRTPFKHFGLQPHTSDSFKEYWYPVMDIGGVTKANPAGALHVDKKSSGLKISFSPLQQINDQITIYAGGEQIHQQSLRLKPLETWETTLNGNFGDKTITVVVGPGKTLVWSEESDSATSSRPVRAPETFDWNSPYGLYTEGINWAYQGRFDLAMQKIEACLSRDSLYAPALNEMAELLLRNGSFDAALKYVHRSLSINTYDPKANFLFGVAGRYTGNLTDALDGFAVASLSPEYRTAAWTELGRLHVVKGDWVKAREYAGRILAADAGNQDALLLTAVALRKENRAGEAAEFLAKLEKASPLNHFVRFERMLTRENKQLKDAFLSRITTELPHETFTEMALWYDYLGCRDEAVRLLELSPATALVKLLLSYWYSQSGERQKSETALTDALEMTTAFALPFRFEFLPVLEWAHAKSGQWKTAWYLALLHWSQGDKSTAKELMSGCGDTPDVPWFYLARADLFSGDNQYNPEQDYLAARKFGQDEWRTLLALTDFYLSRNRTADALAISKESVAKFPESDVLRYAHARCLLAGGLYSESLSELENLVILPHEGARYGRVTYRQAAVMEALGFIKDQQYENALASVAKSRLWPENLGVGKPWSVDERIEDFLEAECRMGMGEPEKAKELYQQIVSQLENKRGRYNSTDLISLAVMKKQGLHREAAGHLASWLKTSPDDPVARWASARLGNNRSAAAAIEKEITTDSGGTPWDPKLGDTGFTLIREILDVLL